MNFKALALAALASISFGAVASPAEAVECVYGNGYELCFEYEGLTSHGFDRWDVRLRNNHAVENMTVVCNGPYMVTWQSRGGLTQSEASHLANYFCAL